MRGRLKNLLIAISVAIGLTTGFTLDNIRADELPKNDPAPLSTGGQGVIEGKVIEVETHTLVVKKIDGNVVRVRMPGKSGEKAKDFSVGEYIEASVTPEGMTTSVRKVVNPQKHDINENIR